MLVLSRKIGEKVVIGGDISVTIVEIKGNRVRLAFEAPDQVSILRSELLNAEPMDHDLVRKPLEWQNSACCVAGK